MSESIDTTRGLLDATQEVVIEAVDNVGQMLKTAESGVVEPFYVSPEFWTGMAFVLAVVALFKPLKKALTVLLQKHIDAVVFRIQQAKDLKVEARALLLEYEKKLEMVDAEVQNLIDDAEKRSETMKVLKKREIETLLAIRKKEATDKIDGARHDMQKEFENKVTDAVMLKVNGFVSSLSQEKHLELIDKSIDKIQKLK